MWPSSFFLSSRTFSGRKIVVVTISAISSVFWRLSFFPCQFPRFTIWRVEKSVERVGRLFGSFEYRNDLIQAWLTNIETDHQFLGNGWKYFDCGQLQGPAIKMRVADRVQLSWRWVSPSCWRKCVVKSSTSVDGRRIGDTGIRATCAAVGGGVGGPSTSSFPASASSASSRHSFILLLSACPPLSFTVGRLRCRRPFFQPLLCPFSLFLSVARSPRHHQRHLAIDARILSLSLYIYIYIGVCVCINTYKYFCYGASYTYCHFYTQKSHNNK